MYGGEVETRRLGLDDIAVFFTERAVPNKGRETQVEQLGEGAGFGGVVVQEPGAIEFAQDGGELFEEDALEVDVFLVRANDVRSGGEGVVVAVAGKGRGGGMGGMNVVGCFIGGDHIVVAVAPPFP